MLYQLSYAHHRRREILACPNVGRQGGSGAALAMASRSIPGGAAQALQPKVAARVQTA